MASIGLPTATRQRRPPMRYEVRRNGRVLYHTEGEDRPYPPAIEAGMQESGHDIYIDGRKQRKVRKNAQGQ